MKQYHDLLEDILNNGEVRDDRTGVGTISVFGRSMRFDLRRGFPAITTKKLAWKACVGELLWFIEGSSDERRLAEITHGTREGVATIWTPNALAPYWKHKAKYEGDLGRVYGVQWRDWVKTDKPPVRVAIDQLQTLITQLKEDPYSRRHILSSWNVAELEDMALPPCHVMSQFYVNKNNELSCHMYQRSVDVFLGIYKDHVDQVKEQLTREEYSLPRLFLNFDIKDITKFTMEDIHLEDYQSHGPLKAPMAV